MSGPEVPEPVHPQYEADDIRTTYHPRSGRPPAIESFDNYGKDTPNWHGPPPEKPWLPFHSESEFEFSKIVLQAALSNIEVDALIKVVRKLIATGERFTVKGYADIQGLWEKAAARLPQVRSHNLPPHPW